MLFCPFSYDITFTLKLWMGTKVVSIIMGIMSEYVLLYDVDRMKFYRSNIESNLRRIKYFCLDLRIYSGKWMLSYLYFRNVFVAK